MSACISETPASLKEVSIYLNENFQGHPERQSRSEDITLELAMLSQPAQFRCSPGISGWQKWSWIIEVGGLLTVLRSDISTPCLRLTTKTPGAARSKRSSSLAYAEHQTLRSTPQGSGEEHCALYFGRKAKSQHKQIKVFDNSSRTQVILHPMLLRESS